MFDIRIAQMGELNRIITLYYLLTDMMKDAEFHPGWKKNVYPSRELLRQSVLNQQLYVGTYCNEFISAMILNHDYAAGYEKVKWNIPAPKEQVTVIHALGILPPYHGQGIASRMVEYAILISRQNQQEVIRLDVLGSNLPAQKLYIKMGFEYIDTLKLFYEDTGLTDYLLYEYVL